MAKAIKKDTSKEEASGKVRTSMYIEPTLLKKIQFIAFMDDAYDSQTDFFTQAITEAVSKWEKVNGEAVKK